MTSSLTHNTVSVFVGIDPSLNDFAATCYTGPGQTATSTRMFANIAEGYDKFIAWLTQIQATRSNAVICIEATGVYAEALCYFLYEHHYAVILEDALKVKRAFKKTNKFACSAEYKRSPY